MARRVDRDKEQKVLECSRLHHDWMMKKIGDECNCSSGGVSSVLRRNGVSRDKIRGRELTTLQKKIIDCYRQNPNYTFKEVANQCKCSKGYVRTALEKGGILDKRKLSDLQSRIIEKYLENPNQTNKEIASFFSCDASTVTIAFKKANIQKKNCQRSRAKDISGQRFGRLTALYLYGYDDNNYPVWLCQCDCGNKTVVKYSNLISGNTKSCGCLLEECRYENHKKDLGGKIFGNVLAISPTDKRYFGCIVWKCKCLLCGEEFECPSNLLIKGDATSCGCDRVISKGEERIADILKENKITYIRQKRFEECKDIEQLPYDFYIESLNLLIEYDGEQHFHPIKFFGGEEKFSLLKKHDTIKNNFAKENNILLLRIPFFDYEKISIEYLKRKYFQLLNNSSQ